MAITLVIAGHLLEYHSASAEARALALSMAQVGVLLFFVLSEFLITGVLYRERSVTGSVDFKQFYLRRILRLAPALLVFLCSVIVLMRLGVITDVPKKELLECVLYARNIVGRSLSLGHIWSLSLEEQFYLMWPVTFFLLPARRAATIVACICGGLMAWLGCAIALNLFSYERGIFYVRPYFRFDSIMIGAFLALCICSSNGGYIHLRQVARGYAAGLLAGLLALWAVFGEALSRPLHITVSEIIVTLLLERIVLCPENRIGALLRSQLLRYLGTISYSLYLWQELFVTADKPSWGAMRTMPLAIVVPLAIAIASYHLMERPILRVKERLAPQASPQTLWQDRSASVP